MRFLYLFIYLFFLTTMLCYTAGFYCFYCCCYLSNGLSYIYFHVVQSNLLNCKNIKGITEGMSNIPMGVLLFFLPNKIDAEKLLLFVLMFLCCEIFFPCHDRNNIYLIIISPIIANNLPPSFFPSSSTSYIKCVKLLL